MFDIILQQYDIIEKVHSSTVIIPTEYQFEIVLNINRYAWFLSFSYADNGIRT